MKVLIVIPALNEERTIAAILRRIGEVDLASMGVKTDIIVVDDGSTDGTARIVREQFPSAQLLQNPKPCGKGHAVKRALEHSDAEYAIIQDADLEYDPVDYPRLLEPIVTGGAQVVYGSRFLSKAYPTKMRVLNYFGNLAGTWLVNSLYGASLTDLMTGYKVVPLKWLKELSLEACGFDMCPELTAKLLNKGVKIHEVPISYNGRTRAEGKKIKLIDSLFIARSLLKYKNTKAAPG